MKTIILRVCECLVGEAAGSLYLPLHSTLSVVLLWPRYEKDKAVNSSRRGGPLS